jgi:hypothetical protein
MTWNDLQFLFHGLGHHFRSQMASFFSFLAFLSLIVLHSWTNSDFGDLSFFLKLASALTVFHFFQNTPAMSLIGDQSLLVQLWRRSFNSSKFHFSRSVSFKFRPELSLRHRSKFTFSFTPVMSRRHLISFFKRSLLRRHCLLGDRSLSRNLIGDRLFQPVKSLWRRVSFLRTTSDTMEITDRMALVKWLYCKETSQYSMFTNIHIEV